VLQLDLVPGTVVAVVIISHTTHFRSSRALSRTSSYLVLALVVGPLGPGLRIYKRLRYQVPEAPKVGPMYIGHSPTVGSVAHESRMNRTLGLRVQSSLLEPTKIQRPPKSKIQNDKR